MIRQPKRVPGPAWTGLDRLDRLDRLDQSGPSGPVWTVWTSLDRLDQSGPSGPVWTAWARLHSVWMRRPSRFSLCLLLIKLIVSTIQRSVADKITNFIK